MALKRMVLQIGMGTDIRGADYTKAAVRAVEDAIHHSSLTFIRTLGVDPRTMQVEVTIGVQRPEKVDAAVVKTALPHGQVTVNVIKGGLDVPDEEVGDVAVIASAAPDRMNARRFTCLFFGDSFWFTSTPPSGE